ncbi:MAG: hypothetical protein M3H12_06355 [Chromatiales bacterium]
MKRVTLLFLILTLPQPVAASHPSAGIDLCEIHKDKLPPGLTAESLPDPQSPGAARCCINTAPNAITCQDLIATRLASGAR